MILCFVIKKSHGFIFVLWATIGLTRQNFPNVNQFFESLYMILGSNCSSLLEMMLPHATLEGFHDNLLGPGGHI